MKVKPPSRNSSVVQLDRVKQRKARFKPEQLGRVCSMWNEIKWVNVIMGVEAGKLEVLCRDLSIDVDDIFRAGSGHVNRHDLLVGLAPRRIQKLIRAINRVLGRDLHLPDETEGANIMKKRPEELLRLHEKGVYRFWTRERGVYLEYGHAKPIDGPEPMIGIIMVEDEGERL